MKIISLIPLLAISLTACVEISAAAEKPNAPSVTSDAMPSTSLVVAELFTSQGCSSCPPAEKLFSTLAEQDNVLTLEWHVDIWNDLVHGGSRWNDPYSSDAFTDRQRSYNHSIRNTGSIYTPQAVVNGRSEGVGSRPSEVSSMLDNASALPIALKINDDTVSVASSDKSAEIMFLRLLKEQETNVIGGENKGRKLAGKNIVLEATILGKTGSNAKEFTLPSVGKGETCAVLVQRLDGTVGPILGAVKCG